MYNGTKVEESTTISHSQLASSLGFNIDEIYNLAQNFFSEKSDKAFHLTFDDRVRLSALTFQVKYGKLDKSRTQSPGILDFVGRRRIAEWEALGDMDSDKAKWEFVKRINELCPLFLPYLEAYSRNLRLSSTEEASSEDMTGSREDSIPTKSITHQDFIIHNEAEIRAALNSQTKEQFETYAMQQYPTDHDKRTELIAHLQDRHFHEYVDYIQHHYDWQQKPQPESDSQNGMTSDLHVHDQSAKSTHEVAEHTTSHVEHNPGGGAIPPGNHTANGVQPSTCPTDASLLRPVHVDASAEHSLLTTRSVPRSTIDGATPQDHVTHDDPSANLLSETVSARRSSLVIETSGEHGADAEDPSFATTPSSLSAVNSAAVVHAPSMWTRGEIHEFKTSLADIKDAIVQVGCGEVITVRVPAYPSGTSIVWEFATDDYDIGFGLFFEWSTPVDLPTAIPCKTADPDPDRPPVSPDAASSPEPLAVESTENPLVDEIIPVYRRNSHQDVYCGSHIYPGLGTYLFKFDNSYSLWRSKTLYYRVYYTC